MVALALHKGGDERNMEPAWDFVKELAKSGNIGRVANADTDVTNSISSGETCVSFAGGSFVTQLARDIKIKNLTKVGSRDRIPDVPLPGGMVRAERREHGGRAQVRELRD